MALIATTAACMVPISSRILQADGVQPRRSVLDSEPAAETIFLIHERT